jgi:hypothetical protein
MAITMAVGDILSARAWLSLDEQAAVNTFNYEVISSTGVGRTDQDFANDFDTGFAAFYKSLVPPTVTYRGIQVYYLHRTGGGVKPPPVSSLAGSGFGTATNAPLPRNTAPILKYSTNSRGPGGRGRIFLPFVSSDFLASNGRPTIAFEVLVNSAASGLLLPFVSGALPNRCTLAWVLLRKHLGADPTVTGQIIQALSADKFGQMHKRGDYGRANESPI